MVTVALKPSVDGNRLDMGGGNIEQTQGILDGGALRQLKLIARRPFLPQRSQQLDPYLHAVVHVRRGPIKTAWAEPVAGGGPAPLYWNCRLREGIPINVVATSFSATRVAT